MESAVVVAVDPAGGGVFDACEVAPGLLVDEAVDSGQDARLV